MGCSSRRRARRNMSIFRGLPTTKCAPERALVPALLHLAQGRRTTSSWTLCGAPSLRVAARTGVCVVAQLDHIDRLASEFDSDARPGLRRAPRIHPVLAATHHAPRVEIGSDQGPYGSQRCRYFRRECPSCNSARHELHRRARQGTALSETPRPRIQ